MTFNHRKSGLEHFLNPAKILKYEVENEKKITKDLDRAVQQMHDLSLDKIGQNGAKGIRFELGFDSKEGKSILTKVNQAFSSAKGFSRQMITGEVRPLVDETA